MSGPSPQIDTVARTIVDAAFAVHSTLGPGLLESAYQRCLAFELESRGCTLDQEVPLPVIYRGVRIEAGYRIDMIVNTIVIVEIKAVEKLMPIHEAQLLTYLKLSGYRLGFLINFNAVLIKHGIKRLINGF